MEKIIARQVPPEEMLVESPFDNDNFWAGISVFGNDRYTNHIEDFVQDTMDKLDSDYWDYDDMPDSDYKKLLTRYYEKSDNLAEILSYLSGEKWDKRNIYGYSQGECNTVYYRENEYSSDDIALFENEYFGMYDEWIIDDCAGYHTYKYRDAEIKREIGSYFGVGPENVTLLKFDGYTKSASYTEI